VAVVTVTVKISVAWWFTALYLPGVILTAQVFGLSPDPDQVARWARRAMKVL
jgi:hypothetical protein